MFPETYRRVLGARGVAAPLSGVTIGRLSIAAQPLSTILLVKGSTGSFAAAGLVEACYALAAAGSLPVQGRVIDRIGQTRVIAVVTVVNALAFAAMIPLAAADAPVAAMAAAGTIAGLATPPLGAAMRSLWRGLVPDPDLRQAAFAIDAVAVDTAFILGPSMAAGVIAVASPSASLGVCVVLTLIGSAVFAASAASRAWRGSPAHERHSSPLRSPGVIVLMGAALGVGTAVGATEIAITAFASEHGAAELGGTLVAIQAAGSVLGGLWFGREEMAEERRRAASRGGPDLRPLPRPAGGGSVPGGSLPVDGPQRAGPGADHLGDLSAARLAGTTGHGGRGNRLGADGDRQRRGARQRPLRGRGHGAEPTRRLAVALAGGLVTLCSTWLGRRHLSVPREGTPVRLLSST